MTPPSSQKKERAFIPLNFAVLTVSDTRTEETDVSGKTLGQLLTGAGHRLAEKAIVPDNIYNLRSILSRWIAQDDMQAVITTGGTGITRRDNTYEAVTALFDKQLDGFGELFRMLSFEEIGAAAMLSRACAGVVCGAIVFVLPGSEGAVRLAMRRLILPELGHIVRETAR